MCSRSITDATNLVKVHNIPQSCSSSSFCKHEDQTDQRKYKELKSFSNSSKLSVTLAVRESQRSKINHTMKRTDAISYQMRLILDCSSSRTRETTQNKCSTWVKIQNRIFILLDAYLVLFFTKQGCVKREDLLALLFWEMTPLTSELSDCLKSLFQMKISSFFFS